MYDPKRMQNLWAAVLFRAMKDATCPELAEASGAGVCSDDQARARAWVGSKDFHAVCALAGFDGLFVLDAYRAGKMQQLWDPKVMNKRNDHRAMAQPITQEQAA